MSGDNGSELLLSEKEFNTLSTAQGIEIEAKVALAELEISYHQQRKDILAAANGAAATRQELFRSMVETRGKDPSEWWPDLTQGAIVPVESLSSSVEIQSDDPLLSPQVSSEELERQRGTAIRIKMEEQ